MITMTAPKLTYKQRKFVELYDGNATKAARLAGYKDRPSIRVTACENLTKPSVKAALAEREAKMSEKRILSRTERQQFWTDLVINPEIDVSARIKASELLGKSEADFTENLKVDNTIDISQALELAHKRAYEIATFKNDIEVNTLQVDATDHESVSSTVSIDDLLE